MGLFDNNAATAGVALSDGVAGRQLDLGQNQFNWFDQAYRNFQPARDAATSRANQVSDASLGLMSDSANMARDLNSFQASTYRPLQQSIVSDAMGFDTPERREDAAVQARADVGQAAAGQQQALSRSMSRVGVNPGSGASMAAMGDLSGQALKASAGAATTARRNVEAEGFKRKLDANSTGNYLPGAASSAAGTAVQAGQGAGAASTTALQSQTSGVPLMQQAFSGQMQANQSAGNLYTASSALRNASNGASFGDVVQGMNGIGQFVGQTDWGSIINGAGNLYSGISNWLSTKEAKTKNGDKDADEALEQVNSLNVDNWSYKPGMGDSSKHVGPYAEDVQKAMGDQAAPGGKMVNLATMSGKNVKAIKSLTAQVEQLEEMLEALEA